LSEIYNDLILAQSMPSGAVHPNTPKHTFHHRKLVFERRPGGSRTA